MAEGLRKNEHMAESIHMVVNKKTENHSLELGSHLPLPASPYFLKFLYSLKQQR